MILDLEKYNRNRIKKKRMDRIVDLHEQITSGRRGRRKFERDFFATNIPQKRVQRMLEHAFCMDRFHHVKIMISRKHQNEWPEIFRIACVYNRTWIIDLIEVPRDLKNFVRCIHTCITYFSFAVLDILLEHCPFDKASVIPLIHLYRNNSLWAMRVFALKGWKLVNFSCSFWNYELFQYCLEFWTLEQKKNIVESIMVLQPQNTWPLLNLILKSEKDLIVSQLSSFSKERLKYRVDEQKKEENKIEEEIHAHPHERDWVFLTEFFQKSDHDIDVVEMTEEMQNDPRLVSLLLFHHVQFSVSVTITNMKTANLLSSFHYFQKQKYASFYYFFYML